MGWGWGKHMAKNIVFRRMVGHSCHQPRGTHGNMGAKAIGVAIILETSVGRARVCGWRVVWQGATTRRAAPCKEEQHSQAGRQSCNRVRSDLTQPVKLIEGTKSNVHNKLVESTSGQLRFLG